MSKQPKEQTDHVKAVQEKQLNKLNSEPQARAEQGTGDLDGPKEPVTDENIIDEAQDKVASEFNEPDLTPEQYAERTEMAAKELEGDTEVTPSEPEKERSPEQE